MSESLLTMRKECEILGIDPTSDLISFMESELRRKGEDYNYNDLLKDVETLSFSFANDLRKRFFFRIPDNKQDYFQKDDLLGAEASRSFPHALTRYNVRDLALLLNNGCERLPSHENS